jgi:hypothetical protein
MNAGTEEGFAQALAWTRGQLALLADGGVWVIPRSMAAVRVVSHTNREVQMIGMEREELVADLMRVLGWRVTAATGVIKEGSKRADSN